MLLGRAYIHITQQVMTHMTYICALVYSTSMSARWINLPTFSLIG